VRLPHDLAAVVDHRNHADGIQRPELRLGRRAEAAAPVHALERESQLLAGPEHLAHVDRLRVSVDFQHGLNATGRADRVPYARRRVLYWRDGSTPSTIARHPMPTSASVTE